MKIIRRLATLCLCLVSVIGISACSSTTVYQVEKDINQYLARMTKGYTQYTESPALKSYELYKEEKVLTVKLKQGLSTAPSIEITTGKNKKKTIENNILTIYTTNEEGKKELYGSASALSTYFDPYRNTYVPRMRVYQKDGKTFRAIFFISNQADSGDDFYPFYLAFTGDGYKKALNGVIDYVNVLKRSFASYSDETVIPDYITEFKSMFIPVKGNEEAINTTYGDRFTNLTSADYVLYAWGSNYPTIIDEILPQYAGIDMQYMRDEYKKLGYTEENLDIIVVTADIVVTEDGTSVSVTMNEDVFYSNKAKAAGVEYIFEFCPTLSEKATEEK